MGRREGTQDKRVQVLVSTEMKTLRQTQTTLNKFVWSTDICYGYFLKNSKIQFSNLKEPAINLIGDIESEAWFPNNQGYIKLPDTIGDFSAAIKNNIGNVYKSVLVYFYSALEDYLEKRISKARWKRPVLKDNKEYWEPWGPFSQTLSHARLINNRTSLKFTTVIKADICRRIRNKLVHNPGFTLPTSLADTQVTNWQQRTFEDIEGTFWKKHPKYTDKDLSNMIKQSFNDVFGQVANHIKETRKQGKDLPIELFYMLFSLTNFDKLACEIEEALCPHKSQLTESISRKEKHIRRTDLIVPGPVNEDEEYLEE